MDKNVSNSEGSKKYDSFMDQEPLLMAILRYGAAENIGKYKSHVSNQYRVKIRTYDAPVKIDSDGDHSQCIGTHVRMQENPYGERIEGMWWESGDLYILKTFPAKDNIVDNPRWGKIYKILSAPESLVGEISRIKSIHRMEDTYSLEEGKDLAINKGIFNIKIRQ